MKEKLYRHTPLVLAAGGFILWLVTFSVDRYFNHSQVLIWLPFVSIKIIACFACGVLITKLYSKAYTDKLTGLGNRAFFDARLFGLQVKGPVSLLLIDVDNFKKVNDAYGHLNGDNVLREFAVILQGSTRKSDIISRWGGEEFAVILPDTSVTEGYKIAERIREIVADRLFACGMDRCSITVSVGLASTSVAAGFQAEQLLRDADMALFEAKEKKNSIIIRVETPVPE